ncbi:hypothetical protein [Methanosarcina sp. 1.H.T.1A.1]|uniref:hypothetical protein n=1 Tax=Methanosarcina sp. 1.H.T.1A.1 TaxID=1483602 RepID=UPI000AFF32EF|nr:hypothetical protein [Methanosarcina sp. 1.H.T.1A.1]
MKNGIKNSHGTREYFKERTVCGTTFSKVYVDEMQNMIISCILDISFTGGCNVNL